MLVPLTLALTAAVATIAPAADPVLHGPKPGPEAMFGYRLLEAGRKEEGCDRFLTQIREGTRDPWAFTLAFTEGCFETRADFGEIFRESLAGRSEADVLVVLGRGILHASRSEILEAEVIFDSVVRREPEMAPGWLLLGQTLIRRGDYEASVDAFDNAVKLSPEFEYPRHWLRRAQRAVDVFDRLQVLLAAIPERWATLPEPRVPVSGRRPQEVLAGAPLEEVSWSQGFFESLLWVPERREEKIRERLNGPAPTEVDLWIPRVVVERDLRMGALKAALAVEAWLQWSEALGRRDALLDAASLGIDLLRTRTSPAALLSISRAWVGLLPAARSEADEPSYSSLKQLYGVALLHARLGAEALQVFREERAWLEKTGDSLTTATVWLGEGGAWELQLELDEALRSYGRARELAKAVGDGHVQGAALLAAALVHLRRIDNEKALAGFREARTFLEAAGDSARQGLTWAGEGEILLRLLRYDEASWAYAKARPLFEAARDEQGLGEVLFGEAAISRLRWDSATALRKYRQARDHFAAAGDEVGLGKAWLGEAEYRGYLGDPEVALTMYSEARAHSEKGKSPGGVGNAWLAEGDLRQRLDQDDKALHAYGEARRNFIAAGDRLGEGHTWIGEGNILARRERFPEALEAYRKAHELFPTNPRSRGFATLGEARVLPRLGRLREAAEKAASAAELFLVEPAHLPGRIESLLLEQEALQALDDWDRAAAVAAEAIQVHAVWRKVMITDAHRTQEDVRIARAYDFLIPLRVREGRDREALTLAEEARSRVLLDLLATRSRGTQIRSSTELHEEKQRLQKEQARIEGEIAQTSDAGQRFELERERRRVDREMEWNRYEQAAAGSALQTSRPLDAEAIQALSREIASPILIYYVAFSRVFGFLVRPDQAAPVVKNIAIPWYGLFPKPLLLEQDFPNPVRTLAHGLANPVYQNRPETRARARELWDQLIQPFVPDLPQGGPLVLVPHGPLHELPFEALLDPRGSPLFRSWDVTVVPSVSALSFRRQRPAGPPAEDALLTFSSGRGLSLPEREVARITPFFNTIRPTEPLFSRYEEAAAGAHYLFFATHGIHVEGNQSETYLELLPGEDHDSRLSAAEIAAIPLQAELVTLAACDTSHGTPLFSDERLGLTRSFLIAGAAAVLATRWKVPEDSTTSRFLEDFFRAYRQGGPDGKGLRKDQALSEARRRSQLRGDPAQLWAGWVLVGDPR